MSLIGCNGFGFRTCWGDHGERGEELALETIQQGFSDGGFDHDLDLHVGHFTDIGVAISLVATAMDRKGCVAICADLAQQFDNAVFEDRLTDDGNEFHGMKGHEGVG
jgi:hypothetical protein